MSIFSGHILKLLNDYKRLLRRYVSKTEREKIILTLGIKRKSLKFDNDVILYNKAQRVLQDIEYWRAQQHRTATEHSGINRFYEHLKSYLNNYHPEKSTIVHLTQKVSCALIEVIQIISLPETKFSESMLLALEEDIKLIDKYGTEDQHIMLAKSLNKQRPNATTFHALTPTLNNFIKKHCQALSEAQT